MTSTKIAPECSFRFTTADIVETYGSADGAFAQGDFLNAAQLAPADSDLKGCALILGGLPDQGIAILDRLPAASGRARLCRAFALWSSGRNVDAKAALKLVDEPAVIDAARKFDALLDRDNINIFVTGGILSVFPEHYSASFIAPAFRYGSITATYVGSQLHDNAYDYLPSQSFDEFVDALPPDERPDIVFALSPQWLLAKDFHKVGVPKVIWCHDTDAFHYRNVDNYALYDVAICNCSQEHFELSQGTPGLYCAANMLMHPLATPFPEASPHGAKEFDIIFTGSALAPFHSEKPRFLYKLAELGTEFTVRVVDGHMPERDYFALVSRAKFLPIINRYAGSPSPRWRDALANGSFLLYPEGTFYGEIAPGCFPFKAASMVGDIRAHLERFEAGGDPTYDLADIVPEINSRFAVHRQPREESYERLLKYALFMALVWRPSAPPAPRRQRRLVWLTPAVDCGLFGTNHIRDRIDHIGENIDADDLLDEIDYNNAAHLHAQMVFTFHESSHAGAWASQADQYFRAGLSRFPDSLLLLFNEAHWSFFKPDADTAAAAEKFNAIIERFDRLAFDAHGADVAFAYTLHERDMIFPCYEYADIATSELVLRHTPELRGRKRLAHETRQLLLSACHGYVGVAKLKAGDHPAGIAALERAIAIYPHGLPLLRLYFDTLLRRCAAAGKTSRVDASALADAFIAVVNVNPSVLLTHTVVVVTILANNGEARAAREILAAWYQLANIVHSLRAGEAERQIKRLAVLCSHRALFPSSLNRKIIAGLRDENARASLTQLEQWLVAAAKAGEADATRRKRWLWHKRTRIVIDPLTLIPAASGVMPEHIELSGLRRAVVFWMRAPREIKLLYLNKAYRTAARGGFRRTVLRIQQWSTDSKWSRGEAMNAHAKRRRVGLYRMLRRWLQFGRSQRPY